MRDERHHHHESGGINGAPVTVEELDEALRGVKRLMHRKRFPGEWIERHVPDAMDQALVDFSARLAAGKKNQTVGLLVVIAYRRALKTLEERDKGSHLCFYGDHLPPSRWSSSDT